MLPSAQPPKASRGIPVVRMFGAFAAAALSLLGSGCFAASEGLTPPSNGFYFPTALVASPGGSTLYVVSSDFDLQYDAGTVQALDLGRIRGLVAKVLTKPGQVDCAALGLGTNPLPTMVPGVCTAIDPNNPPGGGGSLIKNNVFIGAFGADAAMLVRPLDEQQPGARLAIAVRGDPSLTWIDVDDDRYDPPTFKLDCAQAQNANRCADIHLAGRDPAENTRGLTMPTEPFQMAVSERSDAIVITHQTTGVISMFVNGWGPDSVTNCASQPSKPELMFLLGGLPTGASGVAAIPRPKWADGGYTQGFLVSYRTSAQVDLFRYINDCASSPSRPFLSGPISSQITTNASGFDSRGMVVVPNHRLECESTCADDDTDCLSSCAGVPNQVFVLNRTPASIVVGETTTRANLAGADGAPRFANQVALTLGPSRVYEGKIIDEDGVPRSRLFVLCFDTKMLYVVDPERLDAVPVAIRTGRGPSAMAFDPGIGDESGAANFAYLAHFTDSYLGVLDLDMRHKHTFLSFVALVGVPTAPRESK